MPTFIVSKIHAFQLITVEVRMLSQTTCYTYLTSDDLGFLSDYGTLKIERKLKVKVVNNERSLGNDSSHFKACLFAEN